ncbi:hypothetical protein MKW98_032523, partial [Papaver atlanticum]
WSTVLKMSENPVSRFVGRLKTNKSRPNKKYKSKANEDPGIVPTVEIEEVFIPGLGSYRVVGDDKKHASTDITFASDPTFRYQHRGSLVSVINYYKVITKHSLRVKYIIERAGWDCLLTMNIRETSHSLIDYIVERFWDTTNTFHFPFGEMGFTPLDWVMLTGLSIGVGADIPYDSKKYHFEHVPEGTMRALPNIRVLGYEYLGICRPDVSKSEDNAQKWPRSSIWNVKKMIIEIGRCRTLLNQLTEDQVTWQPWESFRPFLGSEIGTAVTELSDSRALFSWNGIVN